MNALATSSNLEDDIIFDDFELINNLEAITLVDAGLPEIYQQQVVTNQLLGYILALLICIVIFGLGSWLWQLILNNIFKHM